MGAVGRWVGVVGGGRGVIDAAPACEAHSVIVINNSGLAIWAQTEQFVCPQSRLDKWSQFHWVLCIKQNRCSQGWGGGRAPEEMYSFVALYLQQVSVVLRGHR